MKNVKLLEDEILKVKNTLSTDRLDMSFGEIMNMYENEEIIIAPDFQRLFRWSIEQQSRFIESLILGIPIPPIFVAEDENGKWELVDGLQRLSTIFSFFGILDTDQDKNNWELLEGDLVSSLGKYKLKDLPLKFQLNIKRAACRVEIIRWNSSYDMRFELFNRLNTGGSKLEDQEIRNCIFRGISNKFNIYLKELAQDPIFIELIDSTKKKVEELYLEELILRFTSLYNNENNILKSNISQHMTYFMRKTVVAGKYNYEEMKTLFQRILIVLKPLGREVFRAKRSGGFSTSLYDSIMLGIAYNINEFEKTDSKEIEEKIELLKINPDFGKFTGSGASSKSRILGRLKISNEIFNKFG